MMCWWYASQPATTEIVLQNYLTDYNLKEPPSKLNIFKNISKQTKFKSNRKRTNVKLENQTKHQLIIIFQL